MEVHDMYKVLDVFPIGIMLSVTLDGSCSELKNGSRLTDEEGNEIVVQSIAMTHNQDPSDIRKSTTILIGNNHRKLEKGMQLSLALG
jgi:hypothetical protein